jgi:flagellar basal-body rod protein FlgC
MDFTSAAAISLSGMQVEQTRLDVAAMNLANMHTTRAAGGGVYRPLSVVSGPASLLPFSSYLGSTADVGKRVGTGTQVMSLQPLNTAPRLVYEPGHPDADAKGFVAYPGIDSTTEMVNVMTAVRSYEANVMVINAAKAMASKALTIGE